MFQEKDEGQPKRWGCLIAMCLIIITVSLTIAIILRVLLDSEDEYNIPLVQGKLREDITYFLGMFTLSFFCGCYGCFCCGCACCRSEWFFRMMRKISGCCSGIPSFFVSNVDHLPIHRIREREMKHKTTDCVAAAHAVLNIRPQTTHESRHTYENTGFEEVIEMEPRHTPRLILPPSATGRFRSHSVDIISIV